MSGGTSARSLSECPESSPTSGVRTTTWRVLGTGSGKVSDNISEASKESSSRNRYLLTSFLRSLVTLTETWCGEDHQYESQLKKVANLPEGKLMGIDTSKCNWILLKNGVLQVIYCVVVRDIDRKGAFSLVQNPTEEFDHTTCRLRSSTASFAFPHLPHE